MKITETSALTDTQIHEIDMLTKACLTHDKVRLTYPCQASDDAGGPCRHYLLYEAGGALAAILAMLPLDGQTAECCAFTHPAYRRRGCFSRLLETALASYEEYDILFGVPESCRVALEVLSALGAEPEAREHQMELMLPQALFTPDSGSGPAPGPARHAGLSLASSTDKTAPSTAWTLLKDKAPIGRCLITPVSSSCACLHQLEIAEPLRQKGYGSSFLSLLLPRVAATGIHKIILQVSGGNPAAIALYQKTGFCITETLSFYCY